MTGRTIHLMRHGEPTLGGRMLGLVDCPATGAGIAACRAAAAATAGVSAIVSSGLARADACATAAADWLAVPATLDPRWRELDFGAWNGLHPHEIDPEALDLFHADPDAAPPAGGERWSALVARVADALDAVEHGTLVVTHGGAMRAALSVACGFGARQVWAFALPYACVLTLVLWPGDGATPPGQILGLRG